MRALFVALSIATLSLAALPAFAGSAPENATISSLQKNTVTTISGTVERITDEDEFQLRDATGAVRVYIGPNAMPVSVGDVVTVEGRVDDGFGPMEVYAQRLVKSDGTEVVFNLIYN